MYEGIVERTKSLERTCLEYKTHTTSHGRANSASSYNNPLLAAHTVQKWPGHFQGKLCNKYVQ